MRSLSIVAITASLFLVGAMTFTACATKSLAPSGPTPAEVAPITKTPAKEPWQEKWDLTLKEGKKEGKVVVFMTAGSEVRDVLVRSFKEQFGITVETISGTGREVSERLLSERRAGIYISDVYQGGVTTPTNSLKPRGILDPLEPALVLPDLTEQELIRKTWWSGQLLWVDKERTTISFSANPQSWATINTNLVKREEITSYYDLLNPKWKGKILMFDPTMAGAGGKLFSVVSLQILNIDYWRELAKNEPVFLRDHRVMVEWVVHGKYAMALAAKPDEIAKFLSAGAPLARLTPKEGLGLSTGSAGLALLNRAPHPNAARIFVNWILSRDGASLFAKAFASQSARLDVPTDFIPEGGIRQEGVKYFWPETEEFLVKEPELSKTASEIFGSLLR